MILAPFGGLKMNRLWPNIDHEYLKGLKESEADSLLASISEMCGSKKSKKAKKAKKDEQE